MTLKIETIKCIDRLIGRFLVYSLEKLPLRQGGYGSSFLFIRPGGIGDAVLLIPSILALKQCRPEATIDVLAEQRNSAIFTLCTQIDNIYNYDTVRDILSIFRKKYDIVIDTEQWHRLSALVARMTGAPMLIGYATNERKRMFTHPIPYSHDAYEEDSFLNLLRPVMLSVPDTVGTPFLAVSRDMAEAVQPFLRSLSPKRFVALFPGGSIKERQWSPHRFHDVAKKLTRKGYGIIIVGGKKDIPAGRIIASQLADAVDLCGKLSLSETAGVLQEASLLITGDSGIMHMAYGLGTPIIALFGAGIEKKWAPRGMRNSIINKHVDCSPCTRFGYTSPCKKGIACMEQITVEEVYERSLVLLEGKHALN